MRHSPQPSLSIEFSKQEYWRGLPFPSAGDLPDLGMELGSPALQADSLPSEVPEKSFRTVIFCFQVSGDILVINICY